jgi:hypothetical protein
MTNDDFAKWREQDDEETLIRSRQRLKEIGFSQFLGFSDEWDASNCHVRISAVEGEWEITIHLPDDSWIRARTSKLHGRTRAEIDAVMKWLHLASRRKAEADPRITPAGTLIGPWDDGTWTVTLNDFMHDMDEICSQQRFDNKEEAEAFAAEVRKAREKDELP